MRRWKSEISSVEMTVNKGDLHSLGSFLTTWNRKFVFL
jgi:hypothetical protein